MQHKIYQLQRAYAHQYEYPDSYSEPEGIDIDIPEEAARLRWCHDSGSD